METSSSTKQALRLLKNHFNFDSYYILVSPGLVHFNLMSQVKLIIMHNIKYFLEYRNKLSSSGNIDVISNSKFLHSKSPFYIHLCLCADGANISKYCSNSYWPVQMIMLDLPLHIRQKFHNRVLYYFCKGKPDHSYWQELFHSLKHDLSGEFDIFFKGESYCFNLNLYSCIFDLPGLASVCNIVQFNGKYGCPYCLHPGFQTTVGCGSSRKFPVSSQQFKLRTEKHYRKSVIAANNYKLVNRTSQPFFGIKGPCVLFDFIEYPTGILCDPMHGIFEGVAKYYLKYSCSKSLIKHGLKFNSKSKLSFINKFISNIAVPHNFPRFRLLSYLSCFKAHEFKHFIFYLFVPIYLSCVPLKFALHIVLLSYILRLSCFSVITNELCDKIGNLYEIFELQASNYLPESFFTLNFHMLSHFVQQLKDHGPLQNRSMFPFENSMKKFKYLCNGTVNYDKQIVDNFILYKLLYFDIVSRKQLYNKFCNVIDVDLKCHKTKLIDSFRYVKNGIVFHSDNYPLKKNSCSSICFLNNGSFCKILSFSTCNSSSIVKAEVKYFNIVPLINFFQEEFICHDQETFNLLNSIDDFVDVTFFNILNETYSHIGIINVDDINCRAIMYEIVLFEKKCVICTPLIECGEQL